MVERLLAHRTLGSAPREQLEWLAAHAVLHRYEKGHVFYPLGERISDLHIVLSGQLVIRVDRGAGPRPVMQWGAGDVTGLLPYSRLAVSPGRSLAAESAEVLSVSSEHFPEMITKCHELTAIFVHVMLDRARAFTKQDLHDEKLLSLGRLAAGLAHELNNPASAIARNSAEMVECLFELEEAAHGLGAAGLTPEQLATIGRIRAQCDDQCDRSAQSPLERADREEAVTRWLEGRGLREEVIATLAETQLTVTSLERLSEALGENELKAALRSIGASERTRRLASEIETASARIHSLVAAVRGFTYMDQSNVPAPVAIGQGLADTVAVLRSKAKAKSVTVNVQVGQDLPCVDGFGGELNQVWSNLIANAIDAVPEGGRVDVNASRSDGAVLVSVVDDGPGVPDEIAARIFEPFFTTKPLGEGTGLGLDIARRLVLKHQGQIEVESRPGRTEFRVVLPGT